MLLGIILYARKKMDEGRRKKEDGRWKRDDGRRMMEEGRWKMDDG